MSDSSSGFSRTRGTLVRCQDSRDLQAPRSHARSGPHATASAAALPLASQDASASGASQGRPCDLRVAYLTSRFPKLTETFVLFEMQAVESLGVQLELYPLRRERTRVMHEEARRYLERAHFANLLHPRVAATNLATLLQRPKPYIRALVEGVRANWGSCRYLFGFLAAFPKAVTFARDLERRGVQHVHSHFASHPAAAAWVIHRLTGIPYSFTAHGSDLHRDQHMLREKVAEAAMVVAISEYNRCLILERCGAEYESKVRVIHCGTDTQVFHPHGPPAPESKNLRGDQQPVPAAPPPTLQIACIGTLHEVKGQLHLIRACRILREQGLRFRLHLIGDGPDEAKLRAEALECEVHAVVLFHGRCTRQRLVELLRRTDVVVAPSVPTRDGRREGIPVALMEAMSAGIAVVASSLSGIPELVQHRLTGLLVAPGDVAALAAAIAELASDPGKRHRLAAAARRFVQAEFDQHRCAAQLVAAIRELQEPAPPPELRPFAVPLSSGEPASRRVSR